MKRPKTKNPRKYTPDLPPLPEDTDSVGSHARLLIDTDPWYETDLGTAEWRDVQRKRAFGSDF